MQEQGLKAFIYNTERISKTQKTFYDACCRHCKHLKATKGFGLACHKDGEMFDTFPDSCDGMWTRKKGESHGCHDCLRHEQGCASCQTTADTVGYCRHWVDPTVICKGCGNPRSSCKRTPECD